jgi:peptidoglycan/LPS O-acetylase OafA/YrhL
MPRLVALDGLRGIAALLVLLYHALGETYGMTWFRGGYLAVDFFFMLSGFVVARAYEHRMDDLPGFLRMRAIRLYPTIAAGICVGAVAMLASGYSSTTTAILAIMALLFFPLMDDKGQGIFPINGPQWSLLLEIIANVVHGLLLWRLNAKALAWIVAASFALLLFASWFHGSMAVGHIGNRLIAGIPRAMFGYTVGVLMFRLSLPAVKWAVWVVFAALPVVLFLSGFVEHWAAGPLTILLFPVIIAAGMNATLGEKMTAASGLLGALSYPLYAVHRPAMTLALLIAPVTVGWKLGVLLIVAIAAGYALALLVDPAQKVRPVLAPS